MASHNNTEHKLLHLFVKFMVIKKNSNEKTFFNKYNNYKEFSTGLYTSFNTFYRQEK